MCLSFCNGCYISAWKLFNENIWILLFIFFCFTITKSRRNSGPHRYFKLCTIRFFLFQPTNHVWNVYSRLYTLCVWCPLPATGKCKDCEEWWENTHNPRASSWVLGWTQKNRWCIGRAVQIDCHIKRLCLIGDPFWANKRSLSGRKVKGLAYLAQLPLPSHTERSDYWISCSNLKVLSWQFEVFL